MIRSRFRMKLLVSTLAATLMGAVISPVSAQDAANDPCAKLGGLMQDRGKIIEQIQGFKDKKPTAQEACSVFTKLSSLNKTTVQSLERDGAWCRAPESAAVALKQQQEQIDQGKANACKAAADQKKMQNQQGAASQGGPATGPIGGTGDVLGGPQKLPQGAL